MKKPLIAALIVAALGGAAAAYINTRPVPDDSTLRISGNIEITTVDAAFRAPGRVIDRVVGEGVAVLEGDPIAQLDSTEFDHESELRSAELRAAQAQLAELQAGFRPEEIAQARAILAKVNADAERARSEFERQRGLFERDVISQRELDAAAAADGMAAAQVEEAKQRLQLLESGARPEQIDLARHRVRQAREALALAETRLSYTALLAPISGHVLADHVEPGEQVAIGAPVVTLGDLDSTWLRGYVDETDLGRVRVGQRAVVTTDTYPGRKYDGRISLISSEAEFTPKSVQTTKERVKLVYRIKIDVANRNHELKPGMPADAAITLDGS